MANRRNDFLHLHKNKKIMKSKTRDKSGLKKVSSNEDKKQAKKIHQASKSTQYPREMGHHGTDPETTLNPEE